MFNYRRVLVIGTGISGVAAVKLLAEHGVHSILFDSNPKVEKEKVEKRVNCPEYVEVRIRVLPEDEKRRLDLVVLSPGVPVDAPMVEELRSMGLPIWGEIELAYAFEQGRVVAITGTNGKTTTTSLVGEIMKNVHEQTFVVGNIGIPYTEMVSQTDENSVTVAEISSFQLETTDSFCPVVSAILNITPDHLNRHHTMENYIQAKLDITKNQTKDEVCVLNYEDECLRERAKTIAASVVFFSSKRELEEGVYQDQDANIWVSMKGKKEKVCNANELQVLSENAMAAIAMTLSLNVPLSLIRETLLQFKAIEHRIEFVEEINGVRYYNDSKGTNPDAAIKGIQAMQGPTWLIGGGYDKKSTIEEFQTWIGAFDGKVKKLVLIGETKLLIEQAAEACNFHDYLEMKSLEEAVSYCAEHAVKGDYVLLSPACASWDMFASYEERGHIFKAEVRKRMK